jgi:hypothetical protein
MKNRMNKQSSGNGLQDDLSMRLPDTSVLDLCIRRQPLTDEVPDEINFDS